MGPKVPAGGAATSSSSHDNSYNTLHSMIVKTNTQVTLIMEKLNNLLAAQESAAAGAMEVEKVKPARKLSGDENNRRARRRKHQTGSET